jgi:LysR family nitrogen assimilation transcriptional regulator
VQIAGNMKNLVRGIGCGYSPFMDLRELGFYVRVVECGSFSSASRMLGVAQPSLSARVRGLENALGVALLHRSVTGVRPTSAGETLYQRALSLLQQADLLQSEIKSGSANVVVSVGLPTTVSLHLTVPLVRAVTARFPKIKLRLIESMTGYLSEWLEQGRLDLAVLYNVRSSSRFLCDELLREDLYLVSERSLGKMAADITLDSISGVPLVLPSASHGLRKTIDDFFAKRGLVANVTVEVDSLVHLKALAIAGAHSTILPRAAVREELEKGLLRAQRIISPRLSRSIVIACARERRLIGVAEQVYGITKDLIRNLLGPPLRAGESPPNLSRS